MDVFIADDSSVVRERLANMLADIDGIRVIGEAGDIPGAVEGVNTLRPQTVILDVELPGGTGIDVLKAISGLRPKPRVIMLTNNPQPVYREQCRRAGAEFFFDKTLEFEKVAQVLRVLRGSVVRGASTAAAPADEEQPARNLDSPAATPAPSREEVNALGDPSPVRNATLLAREICGAGHAYVRCCTGGGLPWLETVAPASADESLLFAALCVQVLREGEPLFISDIGEDPRAAGSLLACGDGPMRFFAGVPIILADGTPLATLAVLDAEPRVLTEVQREALQALAQQSADSLELARRKFESVRAAAGAGARPVTRDPLTGLQNRAALHESVLRGIAHATRHAEKLAFLYIDIDNFRQVNETCGRAAGDALLVEAGKRLLASVRGADTVARLGGDEFAVLAQGLRGTEDALMVAQKLHRALSLPYNTNGRRWTPSCSIGVSVFPHDGADGESLLRHADSAMYRAKSGGRGGYELFATGNADH